MGKNVLFLFVVSKSLTLSSQLPEFVGLKVPAYGDKVEDHSKEIDNPGGPEGTVIAHVFCAEATYEHA